METTESTEVVAALRTIMTTQTKELEELRNQVLSMDAEREEEVRCSPRLAQKRSTHPNPFLFLCSEELSVESSSRSPIRSSSSKFKLTKLKLPEDWQIKNRKIYWFFWRM